MALKALHGPHLCTSPFDIPRPFISCAPFLLVSVCFLKYCKLPPAERLFSQSLFALIPLTTLQLTSTHSSVATNEHFLKGALPSPQNSLGYCVLSQYRVSFLCNSGQSCLQSCFTCVQLFATLWTIAHQDALSMGFSRQERWSVLPCPPPGDLPNPGIEPMSLYISCHGT